MRAHRFTFLVAMALAGCVDFDAQYATCVDAGRCTNATTDAGATDAGATDAGADAGATDAGATDAGATDAGATDAGDADAGATDAGEPDAGPIDAGPAIDAGTWLDISPLMPDGGRFGSINPFGPDVTTSANSLTVAYRQYGETPPTETPRHFSVRRFDGGWSLDVSASDRMTNQGFAQYVPFPSTLSFDSPFDRALIVETDATLAFAPDSVSSGNTPVTNIHFTSTLPPVTLDFARTGSALAARGNEVWVAMRRCTESPTDVKVVVASASSMPVVTEVGAGSPGDAGTCLALQLNQTFNLGVGPPALSVNPNNGLKFLAVANGPFDPNAALLNVYSSPNASTTWTPLDTTGVTNEPLPVESVMALAPHGTAGALLAFEDLAPQPPPKRRARVTRINTNGTFSDPGLAGTSVVTVHRRDTNTDVYVWDAIKSLAVLELAGRTWVVLNVLAGPDAPIFVLSIGPTESAWRLHPGPLPSGQLNRQGCTTSRARLSSWQGKPVVVWAENCGGPHTDLVVMQLQ